MPTGVEYRVPQKMVRITISQYESGTDTTIETFRDGKKIEADHRTVIDSDSDEAEYRTALEHARDWINAKIGEIDGAEIDSLTEREKAEA